MNKSLEQEMDDLREHLLVAASICKRAVWKAQSANNSVALNMLGQDIQRTLATTYMVRPPIA